MDRLISFLAYLALLGTEHMTSDVQGASPSKPIVDLVYGSFQGNVSGNMIQFLGIPFAQPPIGKLRFGKPQPPLAFSGVQDASVYGSACPQQALTPVPGSHSNANYAAVSEDCLTVNVFQPLLPGLLDSKLPVMVWFHGGAFEIGSGRTDPTALLERSTFLGKPIIFVAPNYRVNAFGFLAGREVAKNGLGNLGLRDQLFVLQWVQDHIAAFGGDPSHVVIGGLSAGGISAGLHLVTSHVDQPPLFHGAFMESGAVLPLEMIYDGQAEFDQLAAETNCTYAHAEDPLDCLRGVPFEPLMAAINNTRNIFSYSSLANVWKPRVDGDVFLRDPYVSLERGMHAKVPIIVGACDDEGTIFSLVNLNITTNDQFLAYIHANYFPDVSQSSILRLGDLYPDDPTFGSPFDTGTRNALTPQFKRLAAFQGDLFFQAPRRFVLQTLSKTQDAWGFVYRRGKSTPTMGAGHGTDGIEWFARNAPVTDSDFFAVDAFVQFITTLTPNVPRASEASPSASKLNPLPFWPTWDTNSTSNGPILSFADGGVLEVIPDNFRAEAMALVNSLALELRV